MMIIFNILLKQIRITAWWAPVILLAINFFFFNIKAGWFIVNLQTQSNYILSTEVNLPILNTDEAIS